jgi:pimeloyl-ACP methyl ester carboxylesterase
MRIAAGFPERVEKLILVASVSGDRFPSLPPTPILRPFMAAFGRLSSRFLLQRGFYDRAKLTEELREGYRGPRRIRGFMDGIYRLFRDWRHDRPIDFEKITQPVLILWARAERLPSWMLDRLRKRLPQAEVRYVEEAGHLVLEEQPEAANRLMLRFLAPLEVPEKVPTEPQTDVATSSDGLEVA